jgi:uncharacterized membrane protein YqjE
MELVVLFSSLLVAVGSIVAIWSVRHIRKHHYTPKSTRSTYISKKRPQRKKRPKPLYLGLEIFLEATAVGVAFLALMGFVVGWKPEFSWIPSLMIGYVVGSIASIYFIRKERKAEQG